MRVFIHPEVDKFIKTLQKSSIAKVLKTIDLLKTFGSNIGMPHSKKVAKDLFELRVRGQQEIRIFYSFHKGSACLLHGIVKKSQKIPIKDINVAIKRFKLLT